MGSISPVLSSGLTLSPLDGSSPGASSKDPQKIREAASQFESLLIGQVFKTLHEDEQGWLGAGEEDESAGSALGMADEYLAQSIAKHGGFGLAKMIAGQLGGASSSSSESSATPDPAGSSHTGS